MNIYTAAKSIVSNLRERGFQAYFAGGWVRDFIMKNPSHDIDIATDASVKDIRGIFKKTVAVGEAFGVVVVILDKYQFELASFRQEKDYKDGRHPSSVCSTNAKNDAQRRDFSINGMFFDPLEEKVIDYVGGKEDIQNKIIRAIGDPQARFKEDKLRMIRAARFSARFNYPIEEETKKAICKYSHELFPAVSVERIWQELDKMQHSSCLPQGFLLLFEMQLLTVIFPQIANISKRNLKQKVEIMEHFPPEAPTVSYVVELFSQEKSEEILDICKYFKLSNKEIKFADFLLSFKEKILHAFEKDYLLPDDQLALFYSHQHSHLVEKILAARLPCKKNKIFLNNHQKKRKQLLAHILRIQNASPLINAQLLKNEGIKPGKYMGRLLKKSQEIAINQNFSEATDVLKELKKTQLWKDSL